jgi:hypothetical protein
MKRVGLDELAAAVLALWTEERARRAGGHAHRVRISALLIEARAQLPDPAAFRRWLLGTHYPPGSAEVAMRLQEIAVEAGQAEHQPRVERPQLHVACTCGALLLHVGPDGKLKIHEHVEPCAGARAAVSEVAQS